MTIQWHWHKHSCSPPVGLMCLCSHSPSVTVQSRADFSLFVRTAAGTFFSSCSLHLRYFLLQSTAHNLFPSSFARAVQRLRLINKVPDFSPPCFCLMHSNPSLLTFLKGWRIAKAQVTFKDWAFWSIKRESMSGNSFVKLHFLSVCHNSIENF